METKTIITGLESLASKYKYNKVCLNEIDYYKTLISAINKLKNLSNRIDNDKTCVLPCNIGDVYWQYSEIDKRINKYKVSMLQQKSDKTWKIRLSDLDCKFHSVCDVAAEDLHSNYFKTFEEAANHSFPK